jgi:hypothetical protein
MNAAKAVPVDTIRVEFDETHRDLRFLSVA